MYSHVCPKCNKVIEYKQKERDLARQNIIVDMLNPKAVWRYDSVNGKFNNVIRMEK